MSDDKEDIMNQFGHVSHAYASSPDFASEDDLDILLNLVKPNSSMVLLDVVTGASDDAKALVRRMCYDTSKIILRHFEIPDMEPLSFTEDNVIILSKKNT